KSQGSGFGVAFEWDIPLLEGYRHHVLDNVASQPSVTTYAGCDTPRVADYLREQKFDAVIVNGWVVKTCLQTLQACKRLRIPCLVRGEANHLRTRAWWKKVAQRFLVRRYAGYLYIGEANRNFYKSYGVPDDRLFPCRYCIELERFSRFDDDEVTRRAARDRWGIPQDAVCFLFSGKFEEKKHPRMLLESMLIAKNAGMKAHALMVGDGVLRAECETYAREQQLPVSFAGFINQSEIALAYQATDCLVLPSDAGETWGLVVNEAMACRRPAIVSRLVGCRRDLIEEGVTGASFTFGDRQALADLLLIFSRQPAQLREMGERAFQRTQDYSPLKAAEGIEVAVESTLLRWQRKASGGSR
ncbi:MAG: glycosyltransferase family 4 protein, partial [Planctomycetales bacterium]|nr:glycosyltransferase family 4 protein [Planctomycetales bacterium]